jgi:hypothetical protein
MMRAITIHAKGSIAVIAENAIAWRKSLLSKRTKKIRAPARLFAFNRSLSKNVIYSEKLEDRFSAACAFSAIGFYALFSQFAVPFPKGFCHFVPAKSLFD